MKPVYSDLNKRTGAAVFTSLLVIGFAMRLAYLFQPMRADELVTYFEFASRPFSVAISNYWPNNHVLHTVLVHCSTGLFGNSEVAIRLPAFVAGVLIVPAVYLVFRNLYNRWTGLLAMGLVVPSSLLISYSTDARGYAIQTLLVLLLVYVALRIKRESGGWLLWTGFVAIGTLAFYTLPTTIYFYGGVVLWLLISAAAGDCKGPRWKVIASLAAACAATAVLTTLLYLPIILNQGASALLSNEWVSSVPRSLQWGMTGQLLGNTWTSWTREIPLVIIIVLVAGFLASIVLQKWISRDKVGLALVMTAWVFAAYFIQGGRPFERTWIPLLPLFLGFAAAGIWGSAALLAPALRRRFGRVAGGSAAVPLIAVIGISVLLCVFVLAGVQTYQTNDLGLPGPYMFKNAKKSVAYLAENLGPHDAVFVPWSMRLHVSYYFLRRGIPMGYLAENAYGAEIPDTLHRVFILEAFGEGHTLERVEEIPDTLLEKAQPVRTWDDSRIFMVRL